MDLEIILMLKLQTVTRSQLKKSHNVTTILEMLRQHCDKTIQIGLEESAGYILLGILMVFFALCVSDELNEPYKFHNQHGVAINSNPGPNPSTDSALVSLRLRRVPLSSHKLPWTTKVVYEYKLAVNQKLNFVQPKFLIELFMQSYYAMKYESITTLLACLTDLNNWHYFKLKLSCGKLKVSSYCKLCMDLPSPSEAKEPTTDQSAMQKIAVLDHLLFLVHFLS